MFVGFVVLVLFGFIIVLWFRLVCCLLMFGFVQTEFLFVLFADGSGFVVYCYCWLLDLLVSFVDSMDGCLWWGCHNAWLFVVLRCVCFMFAGWLLTNSVVYYIRCVWFWLFGIISYLEIPGCFSIWIVWLFVFVLVLFGCLLPYFACLMWWFGGCCIDVWVLLM